jgi:hypothetical protein
MTRTTRNAVSTLVCTLALGTSLAHAQATRTWVSGVGDDANPCSRTAPCKTFAGAISKTAAGGEISVLDPGGFGGVTITKSITLNGDGTLAGILASLTNGIIVNAGVNDVVTIRNISINGGGNGLNGIRYLAGGQLIVDNVSISGFTGNGIDLSLSGNGKLVVRHTSVRANGSAIRVFSTTGNVRAALDNVTITGSTNGLDAAFGFTSVSNSLITLNSNNGAIVHSGAQASIDTTFFTSNATAIQVNAGSTVVISNNSIYNNTTAFGCGGGTLASANNNKTGTSGVGCTPNATLIVQ